MRIPALFVLLGFIRSWECVETRGKRYDGYQVIRVESPSINNTEIGNILHLYEVDIWRNPSISCASFDVMIRPQDLSSMTSNLDRAGAKFHSIVTDVQKLIDEERKPASRGRRRRDSGSKFLHVYHPYEEIRRWIRHFARINADIVRLVQVGITYQGRKIIAAKIGVPRGADKRVVWQDGGIHAREWISGASLMWVMKRLVRGYRQAEPDIVRYLQEMDWYIVPIWNVDGYRYTWTSNRLWRKSIGPKGSYGCFGVDLNRNFDTKFTGEGSTSSRACSDVYRGTHPFSGVESLSVSRFLQRKKGKIAAAITLHSYSQFWLYPYGYTHLQSEDENDLRSLSSRVVRAIFASNQTFYMYGSVENLAYQVPGSSVDWAHDALCVKYSFAVELRDTGTHGFILPARYINPTAKEYFEGLRVVADHVVDLPVEELKSSSCKQRGT